MRTLSFRHSQRGQAMVLGLALVMFACIGLVLVFNSTQVTSTKQRLSTAADAVAYSAAVYRARVLNYIAYSNRAIIANEVAAAQAVTMASWSQYIETTAETIDDLATFFPYIKPYTGYVKDAAEYLSDWTDYITQLELQSRSAENYGYKSLLAYSQELLERTVDVVGMNMVAFEVAKANDPKFFGNVLNTSTMFGGFSKRYSEDADRQRLANVVKDTLAKDPFTGQPRKTDFPLIGVSGCPIEPTKWDVISRRGGTFLTEDLNRWEAADTVSHVSNYPKLSWFKLPSCREFEVYPFGFGGAESSPDDNDQNIKNEYSGYNLRRNRNAMYNVEDDDFRTYDIYSGIEKIRELDFATIQDKKLEGGDRYPVLDIVGYVRLHDTHLKTAERQQLVSGQFASSTKNEGDHLGAVATAQVYFRRPVTAGRQEELASLYNPYWQVRMAPTSALARMSANVFMHFKKD